MIRAGDELSNGFKVAVANPETWIDQPFGNPPTFQPGNYEVQREVSPGVFVKFQASSEQKVLDKAARWLADQAARKDSGWLGDKASPSARIKVRKP